MSTLLLFYFLVLRRLWDSRKLHGGNRVAQQLVAGLENARVVRNDCFRIIEGTVSAFNAPQL